MTQESSDQGSDLPTWVRDVLSELEDRWVIPAVIHVGERAATLTSLARTMRRAGADEETIFGALQLLNKKRCRPPLDVDEVRRIVADVMAGRIA